MVYSMLLYRRLRDCATSLMTEPKLLDVNYVLPRWLTFIFCYGCIKFFFFFFKCLQVVA